MCPACGSETGADARFCRACGAGLAIDSPSPGRASPEVPIPAPSPNQQPETFADGRYQVKRFLGEGGKKKVYLAHDTTLDRDVAFALIKTEGLDDTSRARIQREAQAMGRLGSHPHIVTVFDLGEEQNQPYMVTELMGGGDVEGLIEDATGHRLPLAQAVAIAVETCRGLEFAHSRGIIHRDLKPGNVWLTSDGIAKIGDFGLAVALDRSRLTTEGMMVGTVSYMPPEQAMGGEVTPKSDLYSLGAMLYEMVTGRGPFLGDDSVAIIGQHINTPPVAPTWHNGQCPRALDALILRLLAKSPSERPESATDVLAALDAIDLDADVGAQRLAPLHGEEHPLDSLAGGVFVGRQREMGDLKGRLEDALSGRGRLVTLVGEPGIGKTRTAQELATYAGLRGAQVLWGRCYEEQGVPSYWPWVQAIRSYVRESNPERLLSEMGAGAADIAEIVSDVRTQLPGLGTPSELDDPEQARFRLFDSIATFLRTASRTQPIMLILDDLHWSDQPSLMLLQFVTRELSGSRLLLVGTYRDVELSRRHPLAATLAELTRERLFERVLLRGLTEDDIARFIEMTSGVATPRSLSHAVYTQTEGNPLFVTEVVRLLVQEGELSAQTVRGRDSWEIRIPEGVREVIGRRLNQLTQRCNDTLTIASVIGREFELRHLDRLVDDQTEDMLLDVLEEGLNARVIEELPSSAGRYQFTHALIQETLSDELSLTRRVRLHGRIAEMLEGLYGADASVHASELAHHFALAEASAGSEKLVQYSLLAGKRALDDYAYEEAIAHFERALASKGDSMNAETADILAGLGRAQAATLSLLESPQAAHNLRRAFEYYVENGVVARAVDIAALRLRISLGDVDVIERALGLVPEDSHEASRLLVQLGFHVGQTGEYERAKEAFDRAIAIAERENDSTLKMRAFSYAATVAFYNGNSQESVDFGLHAIELAQQANDLDAEALAHVYVAFGYIHLGDSTRSQRYAGSGVEAAERSRHRQSLGNALLSHAILAAARGDWNEARDSSVRGLELAQQRLGHLCVRVLHEYQVGNPDEAGALLTTLVNILESGRPVVGIPRGFAAIIIAVAARQFGVTRYLETGKKAAAASVLSPTPAANESGRISLALIAVMEADIAAAKEIYEILSTFRGSYLWVSSDRMLGLLAGTMGNLDAAQTHFEDALAFCRDAGYRVDLAWSLCDYADMLLERDDDGDKSKATSLLDESLAISSELGMRPLMERVLVAARDIEGIGALRGAAYPWPARYVRLAPAGLRI